MEEKFWQSIFVYDQYDSTINVKIWQGLPRLISTSDKIWYDYYNSTIKTTICAANRDSMNVALDRPKITVFMKSSYEMP